MEISYRRDAGKSFMVIRRRESLCGYQLEMCTRNQMKPFLVLETVMADGKLEFWYDITGKQSLAGYLKSGLLGIELLSRIIAALEAAEREMENYLLGGSAVLLDTETIYLSNVTGDISFCCCPNEGEELADGFRMLMEYLLTQIDHGEEQAVAAGYRIYQKTLEPNYDIRGLCALLGDGHGTKCTEQKERIDLPEYTDRPGDTGQTRDTDEPEYEERTKETVFAKKRGASWVDEWNRLWGEKLGKLHDLWGIMRRNCGMHRKNTDQIVFEPEPEEELVVSNPTVLLGAEQAYVGKLVSLSDKGRESVILKKDCYCIGSREDADIVIQNHAVSRLHARMERRGGVCYIEDLNSTNGTWINGKVLNYMEKVPLHSGDLVCFANEEYRFEEIHT